MVEKILICTRLFTSSFLVEDPLGEIKVVISPPIIDVSLGQGTVYFFSITLTNLSDMDLRVKTSVLPFTFEENGTLVMLEESDRWSCTDWIELDTEKFTILAKRTFILNGKLSVPQDASGGRWCAITFDIDSSNGLRERMGVKIKTGSLIFVSIPSSEEKVLSIDSFSIEKISPEEITFLTVIRNLGNTYLKIDGAVDIRDINGKRIRTLPAKGSLTVLPEGRRVIRTVWRHPRVEDFTASLRINYGKNESATKELTRKVGYEN